MNPAHCCHPPRQPGRRWKRAGELVAWLVPAAVLILLPKCPMCIVAYVGVATGLGISFTAASGLRIAAIILCVASLLFLAARSGGRWLAWRRRRLA